MRRITTGLASEPVGPVQRLAADLDHLGLLLQEQDRGAPHGAHVDGLVRRVEHQHTTTRPTAAPSGLGPCRGWSPGGTDPSGPGGTAVAMTWRSVAIGADRERAEHPHAFGVGAQRTDRLRPRPDRRARPSRSTKNMYVAQPSPPRPRLDAGEVDAALGELGQAAHEPARPVVARLPRTSAPSSTAPRRRWGRRVLAGEPHEAGLVARARPRRPSAQHRAAVELGRAARLPSAAPRLAVLALGDQAHGVGGRGGGHHRGAAAGGSRRNAAHWPLACGCESTAAIRSSVDRLARDQAVVDRVDELADDRDVGASRTRARRASASTAPSSEFSIGTSARSTRPSLHGEHRVVQRRQRHRLELAAPRPAERLLAVRSRPGRGSRRASVRAASRRPRRPARAAPPRPPRARARARRARRARLAVHARGVAVRDRGEHDAVAVARRAARSSSTGGPTARRRRRSGRASGRRSRRRAAPRPRPSARRAVAATSSTRPCSAANAACSAARVRDQVGAAVLAEHDALRRAQPPEPDGEHEREHQRDRAPRRPPRGRRCPPDRSGRSRAPRGYERGHAR